MSSQLGIDVTNLLAEVVGWALVHFTWQALIVGATVCLGLRVVPQHFGRIRYSLCCLGLSLLAFSPVGTCILLTADMRTPSISKTSADGSIPRSVGQAPLNPLAATTNSANDWQTSLADVQIGITASHQPEVESITTRPIQSWMLWLVAAWLCGVSLLAFRMLGGLLRIQQWNQSATESSNSSLRRSLEQLCDRMQIRPAIRLLESPHTYVPTVVGWLRPVVLVPSSMAAGLAPAELEMLLPHELAQVRPHAYLVTFLQNLLEPLLFFQPLVWWLPNKTPF